MEVLKYKLQMFFKWKLDGAPFYIGKTMYEAHKTLGITDEVFDRASGIFATALRRIKPKMKVFREFVKRVGDLRPEIVIPLPAGQKNSCMSKCDENEEEEDEEIDLLAGLGDESGLRQIVIYVIEKAQTEVPEMFSDWVVDKKIQIRMYTYFIASMISEDFEWVSNSLNDQAADMQINEKFFEDLIELFRQACTEQHIQKQLIHNLLEKLHENKKKMCCQPNISKVYSRQMSIVE